MKQKLLAAARVAVNEERGRILWLLDSIEKEMEAGVKKALLAEAQRHAAQIKLQLFMSVAAHIKRGIISGVQPPKEDTSRIQVPDTLEEGGL